MCSQNRATMARASGGHPFAANDPDGEWQVHPIDVAVRKTVVDRVKVVSVPRRGPLRGSPEAPSVRLMTCISAAAALPPDEAARAAPADKANYPPADPAAGAMDGRSLTPQIRSQKMNGNSPK